MNKIEKDLLLAVADLHQIPSGAFNLRENGKGVERKSSANIEIVPKTDKSGIDIIIKPGTTNESVHIPVIITESGIKDLVYNDFYVGDNSDVLIVAGCGIHNNGDDASEHNGIHAFHIGRNAKVRYVEKHIGVGQKGDKILNPITQVYMEDDSYMLMETTQLGGVSSSVRRTEGSLQNNAKLVIKEKILTDNEQVAKTEFDVQLIGKNSSCEVISRSVTRGESKQEFLSRLTGKNECFGHVECDGILLDKSKIISTPEIVAECVDATLVHEAAIGKIAGDQIIKLMSLGLTDKEAEDMIIQGFLS